MSTLERELKAELLAIYDKCSTIGYRPTYFRRMLVSTNPRFNKGPIETVRYLMIGPVWPGSGFDRLVKAGKVEWTVEWLIAKDQRWAPLFQGSEWVIRNAADRIQAAERSN